MTEDIALIAQTHLGIFTLDMRKRDYLDFHEVSTGAVKAALDAAFEAGRRAEHDEGKNPATT